MCSKFKIKFHKNVIFSLLFHRPITGSGRYCCSDWIQSEQLNALTPFVLVRLCVSMHCLKFNQLHSKNGQLKLKLRIYAKTNIDNSTHESTHTQRLCLLKVNWTNAAFSIHLSSQRIALRVPHVSLNGVSHFFRTCTCTEIDTEKRALMNNAQACSETKVSNYPKSPTSSPPPPRYTICGNCRNSFGRSCKCILVHRLHYVQRKTKKEKKKMLAEERRDKERE